MPALVLVFRHPVAQADVHNPVLRATREIINIALHPLVMTAEQLRIAEVNVLIIRNKKERAVPRRTVPPLVSPATRRNNSRQAAVSTLLIAQVINPFSIDRRGEEIEHPLLRRKLGIS